MRRGPRALAATVLAGVLALASGCVAYRSGALPPDGGLTTPTQAPTKSIAVLVRVKRSVNGEDADLPGHVREAWIQATLDGYRSSGLFSEVRRGRRSDTDLQASVRIEDEVVGSPAFAFLSVLTWLVLPSRSQDRVVVLTTYRSQGGEVVGQFRSKETVTTWFQAFLLPFTPFARPEGVIERTVRDLSRATADSARRKGIL